MRQARKKKKSLSNVHLKIKIRRRYDLGAHTVQTSEQSLAARPEDQATKRARARLLLAQRLSTYMNELCKATAASLEVVFLPLAVTS